MKWVALFSQTGSEVQRLADAIREPDLVITNNLKYDGPLKVKKVAKASEAYECVKDYAESVDGEVLVTLNGWLKIVPERWVHQLPTMYNGHPAPITLYTELKGLDPQDRLYKGIQEGKYTHVGTVIHEVSPGVDEGPVVLTNQIAADKDIINTMHTLDARLRNMSFELWKTFLEVKLNG